VSSVGVLRVGQTASSGGYVGRSQGQAGSAAFQVDLKLDSRRPAAFLSQ